MATLLKPFFWFGEIIVTGISAIGEVICILLNTLKQLRFIHKNPVLIVKQMASAVVRDFYLYGHGGDRAGGIRIP